MKSDGSVEHSRSTRSTEGVVSCGPASPEEADGSRLRSKQHKCTRWRDVDRLAARPPKERCYRGGAAPERALLPWRRGPRKSVATVAARPPKERCYRGRRRPQPKSRPRRGDPRWVPLGTSHRSQTRPPRSEEHDDPQRNCDTRRSGRGGRAALPERSATSLPRRCAVRGRPTLSRRGFRTAEADCNQPPRGPPTLPPTMHDRSRAPSGSRK
jgi:hypothetical protein